MCPCCTSISCSGAVDTAGVRAVQGARDGDRPWAEHADQAWGGMCLARPSLGHPGGGREKHHAHSVQKDSCVCVHEDVRVTTLVRGNLNISCGW